MQIDESHLNTLMDYALFQDLIDSTGFVDESVLDKLKLNIQELMKNQNPVDERLLQLCKEVIFHDNMKAFGLHQLVILYINWQRTLDNDTTPTVNKDEDAV